MKKMKYLIALFLCLIFLITACSKSNYSNNEENSSHESNKTQTEQIDNKSREVIESKSQQNQKNKEESKKMLQSEYFKKLITEKQESDPSVQWEQFGPGMSGYNEDLWYHPTDPDTMYITPDMFIAYRSTDNGESWHIIKDCDGDGSELKRISGIDFSHQDENFGLAVGKSNPPSSSSGQLFITYDKGASWEWYDNNEMWGGPLSAVRIDPNDDNICYIGSGDFWNVKENIRTYESPHGLGTKANSGKIWKSTDRGKTWKLINKGIDERAEFGKIFINPDNSLEIFCATSCGVYKSEDGGESWKLCNNGLDNGMIRDMAMYYDSETKRLVLYVIDQVMWEPDGKGSITYTGGIFKSTDHGESWHNITSNLEMDLSKMHPYPQTLYYYYRAIAKWFNISIPEAKEKYPNLPTKIIHSFNRIVVDPNNENKIYVSHNLKHAYSFLGGDVWTTDDGGESWYACTRIGYAWQEKDKAYWENRGNPTELNMTFGHLEEKMRAMVYDIEGCRSLSINSRGEVIIGIEQRLLRSTDGGKNWYQIDEDETEPGSGHWVGRGNSNLPGRSIHMDERMPGQYYILSGEHGLWKTTDDGWKVREGAQAVDHLPDVGYSPSTLAIDPEDPNTLYALLFRQNYRGEFRKSTDGGETWTTISTPIPNIKSRVQQYSLIVDPENNNNIYFCVPGKVVNDTWPFYDEDARGRTGVYKSQDGGLTWKIKNNGLPDGAPVNNIVFDPRDSSILYAAVLEYTTAGGLFVSHNGGDSWEKVSIPSEIRQVNNVYIDSNNYKIYISCGTKSGIHGGVWVSEDDGKTWNKIFNMPFVTKTTTAKYDPDRIMVSVGLNSVINNLNPGIYLSEDGGATWKKINKGLGQPDQVYDIKFDLTDPNVLWCTLRGSGFYKGVLNNP